MQIEKANEKFIDLKELCSMLLIKGISAAKKWCEEANIKIQVIGTKYVAHRFLVELELDKDLIQELQTNYPHKWDRLYQCYQENDKLGYIQLLGDEKIKIADRNLKRLQKKSNRAEKLDNL